MKTGMKVFLWVLVPVVLAGGGYFGYRALAGGGAAVSYRTAPVTRGDLVATIGATGTLEPEDAVDVGAQVTGQIASFGADGGKPDGKPVDRRSIVRKGDLLAKIDDAVYQTDLASANAQLKASEAQLAQATAQLAQTAAQLTQSDANIAKAQADVRQMEAKLAQAEQDWNRAQKVKKEMAEALADTAYDNYRAIYLTATASLESSRAALKQVEAARVQMGASQTQAQAAIRQAEAQILKDRASVQRAQRNVDYCTITSPVDGEIIDRRVNIGQTVVSNMSASSLFLIAKDLARMQIWVSVNEADISSIHPDQPVSFTVDAQGGRKFEGTVTKVRFDATMTSNVVTYPVEVTCANQERLLFPYMTANVQFVLDKRTDVLKVPSSALSFQPSTDEQIAPEFRADLDRYFGKGEGAGGRRNPEASSRPGGGRYPHAATAPAAEGAPARARARRGVLWVQQGQFLAPVEVRVGLTDGSMTEVTPAEGSELTEGLNVVVAEQRVGKGGAPAGGGGSPFMPQVPRRR